MIQAGTYITQHNDPLKKVKVAYVFGAIKNAKPQIQAQIRQLRQVRQLNPQSYSVLKRKLPYLVCGMFNPPLRRKENFSRIQYFMLDIDHVHEKQLTIENLMQYFKEDQRIVLGFVSPGGDGIKLLFKLDDYCYDMGKYTAFYKVFAMDFAKQYGIDQVIDSKTCDVTRACFISYDPEAFYNPEANNVKINAYLNFDDTLLVSEALRKAEKESQNSLNKLPKPPNEKEKIPADIFDQIKQKLNPRIQRNTEKNIFVPEQLEAIIQHVEEKLLAFDFKIEYVKNIHYGKKVSVWYADSKAEINLFYGKRGFSVVESPKKGTHAELNTLAVRVIQEAIHDKINSHG